MLKRTTVIFLMLAYGLAACTGGAPTAVEATVTTAPPTAAPAPTRDFFPNPTEVGPAAPPGCTVVAPRPTPGPTQQSLFPAISEVDWAVGPEDAKITIIEYSDFQ